MHIDIINIGNSKGIRIPAKILQELDGVESFSLEVESNKIVLKPKKSGKKKKAKAREGWDKIFKNNPPAKNDDFIFKDIEHDFDQTEWKW